MSNLRSIDKKIFYKYIKEWALQNSRSPTKEDFMRDDELPSPRTLEESIKIPWNMALKELGLEQIKDKSYYMLLSDKELLEEFKREYERIKPNNRKEFNKLRSEYFPSAVYLEKRFNLKWNKILTKCGFETRKNFYTKEEYFEIFKKVCNKLGRAPSSNELQEYGKCDAMGFVKAFNAKNYNDSLKKVNYNPSNITPVEVPETDEELIKMYVDYSNKLGKPATQEELNNSKDTYNSGVFMYRFTTMSNLKKLAGFKDERKVKSTLYTKEEITDILITLYKKYNRRLTTKELMQEIKENDYPSFSTIQRHFKTSSIKKMWGEIEKKF